MKVRNSVFFLVGLAALGWVGVAQAQQWGYGQPPMAYGGPMMYAPPTGYGYAMPAAFAQEPQPVAQDSQGPTPYSGQAAGEVTVTGECCPGTCGEECPPKWQFYGEFLYLRPRNAEVGWAVPIDGPITQPPPSNPIQIGPVAVADIEYHPGFRVGGGRALDECASIGLSYTWFESRAHDETSTQAPNVIRSMVSHPATRSAATDFLRGEASNDVDFQLGDADYRCVFICTDRFSMNWLVGARYAEMQQDFQATFANNGTEQVISDISFNGGGVRLGLEAERHSPGNGMMIYGRSAASFVAGEFHARYFQGQSFDPTVVSTEWSAGRVVPILELELGAGWVSPRGHLQLSAGYMFSGWFNVVKTDDFIRSVKANDFGSLGDTITFDGLVARIETRW